MADRLGHASIAVTESTYAHQFDAANRSPERWAMLEAIYGKPMERSDGSGGQQTAAPWVPMCSICSRNGQHGSRRQEPHMPDKEEVPGSSRGSRTLESPAQAGSSFTWGRVGRRRGTLWKGFGKPLFASTAARTASPEITGIFATTTHDVMG